MFGKSLINKEDTRFSIHGEAPPDYHLLNIESLKEVLRENTHLFSDEDVSEAISRVFAELRGIEDREVYFGRAMGGYTPKYADGNERFYRKERKELNERLSRLEMELERLAKRADLQVDLLDE